MSRIKFTLEQSKMAQRDAPDEERKCAGLSAYV